MEEMQDTDMAAAPTSQSVPIGAMSSIPPGTSEAKSGPVHGLPVTHGAIHPMPDQEVALDRLVEAAGPLVTAFFENQVKLMENQAAQQERNLAFEERVLEHETRRHCAVFFAAAAIGALILGFAGFLVWNGRDAIAVDIIKTLVTLASVAFGGYGVAVSRHQRRENRGQK